MVSIRRADERGRTNWPWLDSRHSFSFGEYFDPSNMGHRTLRVINDDRVAPGAGFGAHPHHDMEILSYVLDGALEHKDSLGNGSTIRPGEIQHMRAGSGVVHSEYNPSATEATHFLQIWIVPGQRGLTPAYGQYRFDREKAAADFVLLASRDGRSAWVHVARGSAVVNGRVLSAGDAAEVSSEMLTVTNGDQAEILVFDIA